MHFQTSFRSIIIITFIDISLLQFIPVCIMNAPLFWVLYQNVFISNNNNNNNIITASKQASSRAIVQEVVLCCYYLLILLLKYIIIIKEA